MIKKLITQVRFCLWLWRQYDGVGYRIGLKDAIWYAKNLSWWGLD